MSKDTEEGTKPPLELRKINCRKNSVVSLTESRESHKVIPSSNGSTSSQTLSPFLQTPLNPGHSRSWSETSLQLSEEAIESTIRFLNYGTENENVDPKFSFPLKFAWFREKLSWTLPIFVRVFHFCKVLSLLTKWSIILLARLGLGYKWIFMMIRTVLFAVCLGNVLIQYVPRYFWDKHLLRSVPYGPHGRNRLDILLPIPVHAFVQKRRRRPLPVVLFITGGAWTIGYKAWGYLLGQQVIARNHIFISADYRNYPQGTMDDMVMDISAVLQWTRNNIERYGGDVNNITIATQSAGSHITMLALMRQTMRSIGGPEWWKIDSVHPLEHAEPHLNDYEIDSVGSPPSSPLLNNNAIPEFSISCNKANSQEQFSPTARKTTSKHPTAVEMTWLPSDFKRFVGMGGVYDLSGLQCYLHQRGLYMWLLQGIVGNGRCINDLCPMSLLDHDVFRSNPDAVRNIMVPEMLFLHGDDDKSSPLWNCIRFAEGVRFRKYCSHVAVMVRRGHSHTDSMIEGIVDGSSDTANVMLTPVELMKGDCCEWVNGYPVRRSSQSVARNMKSKLVSSVSRTDSMFEQSGTPGPSLAYSWQTSLARWVNPF